MAKAKLDKAIKVVSALAAEAKNESLACCAEDFLDARDQLGRVAGFLRRAEGELELARAEAGQINTGGIARSGGT